MQPLNLANVLTPLSAYVTDILVTHAANTHTVYTEQGRLNLFDSIQTEIERHVRDGHGTFADLYNAYITRLSTAATGQVRADLSHCLATGLNNVRIDRENAFTCDHTYIERRRNINAVMERIFHPNKVSADYRIFRDFVCMYWNACPEINVHFVARFDYEITITDFMGADVRKTMPCLPMFKIAQKYYDTAADISAYQAANNLRVIRATNMAAILYATDAIRKRRGDSKTKYIETVTNIIRAQVNNDLNHASFVARVSAAFVNAPDIVELHATVQPNTDVQPESLKFPLRENLIKPLVMFFGGELRKTNRDIKPHTVTNRMESMIYNIRAQRQTWHDYAGTVLRWAQDCQVNKARMDMLRAVMNEVIDNETIGMRRTHGEARALRIYSQGLCASFTTAQIIDLCSLYYGITELDAHVAHTLGISLYQYLNTPQSVPYESDEPAVKNHVAKPPLVLDGQLITTENAHTELERVWGYSTVWVEQSQVALNALPVGRIPKARLTQQLYQNGGVASVKFGAEVLCFTDRATPLLFAHNGVWDSTQLVGIKFPPQTKPYADREAIYGSDIPLAEHPSMLEDSDVQGGHADNENFALPAGTYTAKVGSVKVDENGMLAGLGVTVDDMEVACVKLASMGAKFFTGRFSGKKVNTTNAPKTSADVPLAGFKATLPSISVFEGVTDTGTIVHHLTKFGLTVRLRPMHLTTYPTQQHTCHKHINGLTLCYNFNGKPIEFNAETGEIDTAMLCRILDSLDTYYTRK